MSKTFTLFKSIAAPKGSSTHEVYTVPVGRSAIVDMTITLTYTSNSGSGSSGSSGSSNNITLNISVVIRKQTGSSGLIGSDSVKSNNTIKLDN